MTAASRGRMARDSCRPNTTAHRRTSPPHTNPRPGRLSRRTSVLRGTCLPHRSSRRDRCPRRTSPMGSSTPHMPCAPGRSTPRTCLTRTSTPNTCPPGQPSARWNPVPTTKAPADPSATAGMTVTASDWQLNTRQPLSRTSQVSSVARRLSTARPSRTIRPSSHLRLRPRIRVLHPHPVQVDPPRHDPAGLVLARDRHHELNPSRVRLLCGNSAGSFCCVARCPRPSEVRLRGVAAVA